MSYLLDKKNKRKKFLNIALSAFVLIVLFYFRTGIFNGLSYMSGWLFRPVLILGNNINGKLSDAGSYFYSKKSLLWENEDLKLRLNEQEARTANYNSILDENLKIKEILGRLPVGKAGKNEKVKMILSAILSKPNQSPYDTLIIDTGTNSGVKTGNIVFALGNVPIGRVSLAYDNSSKVILFSNAGERTQAIIAGRSAHAGGDVFMEVVGRGGGNFEMTMPKDFILQKGDQVVLPGINSLLLAVVEKIISDPRNPFAKALLSSPVNIQELKFVEVEI